MTEQKKLNVQKQNRGPLQDESKEEILKAYTKWGTISVAVAFSLFLISIILFVIVILNFQRMLLLIGMVVFVAGMASGLIGIPLLQASAKEKTARTKNSTQPSGAQPNKTTPIDGNLKRNTAMTNDERQQQYRK